MDELELLLSVFRPEVAELLDDLGQHLEALATERSAERQRAAAAALRIAHNIKGAAASVGLEPIERLAHAVESAVSRLAKDDVPPATDLTRAMAAAVNAMTRLVEAQPGDDVVAILAALEAGGTPAAGSGRPAPAAQPEAATAVPPPTPPAAPTPTRFAKTAPTGPAAPAPTGPAKTAPPGLAAPLPTRPAAPAPTGPVAPPPSGEATLTAGLRPDGPDSPAARDVNPSVRIETKRLDLLMGYAGALLTTRARMEARNDRLAQLQSLLAQARERLGGHADELDEVALALQHLVRDDRQELFAFSNLTDAMGEAMKRVRMLPLASAGPSWRRIVRETGQDLGKEVRLDVEVGDIEVDKWVLDSLRDPVMHLLRNAVDHGLEMPSERAATGKDRVGRIEVRASMRGSMVCLAVADDGRGLDTEEIRRVALARQFASAEQLAAMTEPEVFHLLVASGFSTTERVSHISGRGVGLDIVRRAVEQLGGSLDVARSASGPGTVFTLTLPVTVLSTKGLLVSTHRAVYAVPIEDISRTLRVAAGDIKQVDGRPTLVLDDGQLVRVSWLAALMGEPPAPAADMLHVLVLRRGNAQFGVVVKAILSEQQFVAKRLPWNLKSVAGISGAVLMADGSIALALDLPHLFRVMAARSDAAGQRGAPVQPGARRCSILLVDDSATARLLERNVLVDAGFEVVTAVNGREAWGLLQRRGFDLVVSDVQMPEMDGLELTRKIRGAPPLRHLPVVLVTGLKSAPDLARGADAGANEYIVKSELEGDKLVAAVNRLL